MTVSPIYLDNNSTTPIDPRVVEAMTRAWGDCGADRASQHALGRKARRMLEEAREGIGKLFGAKTGGMDADQVIFTSGGTEANSLALLGLADDEHRAVAISAIEHPSVVGAAEQLVARGLSVTRISVGDAGVVTSDSSLPTTQRLVSMMLANNETGVVQPVGECARIYHESGALIHADVVQAVGKIPVHFGELGIDAMTVAPHKFHGPLGISALIVQHGVKLKPQLLGGFQQGGLRPGTENVALAVGFHEALRLAISELSERTARMRSLRDELEADLLKEFPELIIVGHDAPRLPNTSCISFSGLNRQALVMALDLAGVCCSTGSACASGSSEPSPTLVAMGLAKDVIEGAIRLSLRAFTTSDEVIETARRIIKTVKHLRSQK